jgi:SAM-dependent methyltransferase
MIEDKQRWNKKYETAPMPSDPIKALSSCIDLIAKGSKALDIACGKGRHTHFMADREIYVDAVDYSDVALDALEKSPYINPVDTDLDHYSIEANSYDIIVCTNFLSRRLFPFIKDGLKEGGIVVFETFMECDHPDAHQTTNIEYLLRNNELLHTFLALNILFYEERQEKNLRGEVVKVATLVAQK